jgi:hypothetical protein
VLGGGGSAHDAIEGDASRRKRRTDALAASHHARLAARHQHWIPMRERRRVLDEKIVHAEERRREHLERFVAQKARASRYWEFDIIEEQEDEAGEEVKEEEEGTSRAPTTSTYREGEI